MFIEDHSKDMYTPEQMKTLKTRQLLAHLRRTYVWGDDYDYTDADWKAKHDYQALIKAELATREHIPNKKESKAIRIARIKKGR